MRGFAVFSVVGLGLCGGLAACSGTVTLGTGTGGSAGTTSTTSWTTTTSSTTWTTTTSTTTGTGGSACYETHDGFDLELDGPDNTVWGCNVGGTQTGDFVFDAVVLDAAENSLALDACPPNADCTNTEYKLSFSAPGLYSYIPVGTFVEVSVHVYQPWGCEHALQIKNLPSWGGVANPYYPDDRVWLVAADGALTTFPGTPFAIEAEALGCYPNEPPGCGIHDDYRLVFVPPGAQPVALGMGETGSLWFPSQYPQYFDVRNLRSYETGWCDDYWNWAYFAVQNMMVD
ncbi:MAG: hypothetical protein IT373_05380 [Polyangiaceae bacterium]|nr:hypothetical protein [Polyangiaceae bacterium]